MLRLVAPWSCVIACVACSSSSATGTSDAGVDVAASGETATTDTGGVSDASIDSGSTPTLVKDQGTLVDYGNFNPLVGFTVTEGDASTTTDDAGHFVLEIPPNTPLSGVVTGPNYVQLLLQERTQSGDDDRGSFIVPNLSTWSLEKTILNTIATFDATKAIVYVKVIPTGTCTTAVGGTISVTSPPGTAVAYFMAKIPSKTSTSITSEARPNHLPDAVIFNITPGAPVQLQVLGTSCTQIPYPTTMGTVTDTGNVNTAAGNVNASIDVFLQ